MKNTTTTIAAIISGLTFSASGAIVLNDVIGIDFGPTAADNNYNSLNSISGTLNNLVSLTDGSTVITGVSVNVADFAWSNNDADHTLGSGTLNSNESNLTDWIGGSGTNTITFSGLDDALLYDIQIGHAFSANTTNTDTDYSVDGQTATAYHDNVAGSSFVNLSDLSTDGSGNLVISLTGASGASGSSFVSAMTLTASDVAPIPEPSSAALLGLGGLALISRRKR